jgi:hypothetical protein
MINWQIIQKGYGHSVPRLHVYGLRLSVPNTKGIAELRLRRRLGITEALSRETGATLAFSVTVVRGAFAGVFEEAGLDFLTEVFSASSTFFFTAVFFAADFFTAVFFNGDAFLATFFFTGDFAAAFATWYLDCIAMMWKLGSNALRECMFHAQIRQLIWSSI